MVLPGGIWSGRAVHIARFSVTQSIDRPRADLLAIGAALLTIVLWSSAFVGIRAVTADLSPGSLAFGRLLVGSVALGILVATRGFVRPSTRDVVLIIASGLTWFAIYNLALNTAERSIDAGTASMLVNTGPIFLAIFAGLFLGEGFPARLVLGCAVAFAGAIVIGLATTSTDAIAGVTPVGVVLCLVAAVAYASGVTLQKPALRSIPAAQVTWMACLTGAITLLPFAPALVSEIGTAQASSLGWLVYLGLFPTAIAFTTWAFALKRTTAGRLGSTTYLIPPVVIAMSWLLLGEVPSVAAIAGGILCIAGVVVARSRRLTLPIRRQPADAGA
jgi:drug/metabolite transporter (DMT)-like permease